MINNYPAGLLGTEQDPRSPFYDETSEEKQTELDLFGDDDYLPEV